MTASPSTADGLEFRPARIQDLDELAGYVETTCARAGLPDDVIFATRLAVEEAFTNVVRHGYGTRPGPVLIALHASPAGVTVTLTDEAPPFDPARAPAPDLTASLEEREAGGLGWHLVHQLMDVVRREPGPEGGNVLTLKKHVL